MAFMTVMVNGSKKSFDRWDDFCRAADSFPDDSIEDIIFAVEAESKGEAACEIGERLGNTASKKYPFHPNLLAVFGTFTVCSAAELRLRGSHAQDS